MACQAPTEKEVEEDPEQIEQEQAHVGEQEVIHVRAQKHMHKRSFEELVAEFESPGRISWQQPDTLLSYLDLFAGGLSNKKVAEIGAGTGYISFRLASKASQVIAIDIEPKFLDYIETHKSEWPVEVSEKIETRLAKAENPNLAPGEVDKIILVNTYHHLPNRINYLTNLLSYAEYVIIVDFKKEDIPVGPPEDIKISAESVFSELYQAGYSNARIDKKVLPYQYVIVAQR